MPHRILNKEVDIPKWNLTVRMIAIQNALSVHYIGHNCVIWDAAVLLRALRG